MREIKFKAFIKHLKWMCEVESIDFVNKMVEVDLSAGKGDTSWYPFDEVELVQYTGLSNFYNQKIYEGDIVYLGDIEEFIKDGIESASVFWDEVTFSFRIRYKFKDGMADWTEPLVELHLYAKVMGNVFENKQLLEKNP